MWNSRRGASPKSGQTGTCRSESVKNFKILAKLSFCDIYGLVSTSSRVVWDISYNVLTPYEWMVIIGLELFGNKLCLAIDCSELLPTVHDRKVALNCKHRRSSNAAVDNTE